MERIEVDIRTGERKVIILSAEEEAAALAQKTAWDAANTQDMRAARVVDGIDRLQFEHLFDLENRTRILELKPQITRAQYRDALIARWKALNQ